MRLTRALAALTAACASLLVLPVTASAASDSQLTLTLTQRWQASQTGAWTPYVATVRNDGAADFAGDIVLSPASSSRVPADGWPSYRAHLVVPHGTERSVTLYVVEAPTGYEAALLDTSGHSLASGITASGSGGAGYAVAVLSDQPQAAQRIEALRPLTDPSGYQGNAAGLHVSRFASAQAFPASAVYLAGLHAIVVDDFDASTLSDAQLRAMRDFVELGGSLVVAGGSAWRRTLLPLADHDLGLLRPQRTDQAPLQPLADLVARTTDLAVAAGVGEVKSGRTVLAAATGPPLAVEGKVGAGLILDLAFDPLDQAFANDDTGMAVLAWTFALDRSVTVASPSGNRGFQAGGTTGFPKGVAVGTAAGLAGSADDISSVLSDTPLAQLPPVGLLGGLLVFYVLLAGPVNYLAVRSIRRGELMWITVPVLALLFTGAAYVSGSVARGSTYFDNDVQVLRVAPDGAVEAHGYHAVYPPHRGDFTLTIPANTLATTVIAAYQPNNSMTAVVDSGSQTLVEMRNTPLGAPRTLQTLSVTHAPVAPAIGVETHLKLVNGRVQGTIRNTGDRTLENVRLVSGTGQVAILAKELAPRATATVDGEYQEPGSAQNGSAQPPTAVSQAPSDYKQATVLRIASGQAVSGHQGDLSVVATTASGTEISIAGLVPSHSSIAGVVEPVTWDSVDALSGIAPRPELVISSTPTPFHKDVFDLALPDGYTANQVKLTFFASLQRAPVPGSALVPAGSVRTIEVYNWTTGAWQTLTPAATNAQQSIKLDPATYAGGLVRIRVDEQSASQSFMSTLSLA